jgi:ribonuclease R
MAAERETVDRVIAAHLADQVGGTFAGRVAGVTRVGLFVKLSETGADGFVPAGTLGDDYFRFEEGTRSLVGTRTKETFQLGGAVKVRLVEAAPFAGALRFEIVRPASESRAARNNSRPASRKSIRKDKRR